MMKFILISIALSLSLFSKQEVITMPQVTITHTVSSDSKQQAFKILQNRCNSCHRQKNKKRVFTMANMDDYGKKIYKQVFVWKRMPKRPAPKLTSQEIEQLKEWLLPIITK